MRVMALVAVTLGALAFVGMTPAVAQDERGVDPNQGRSLVEVRLDSRAAAMRLQQRRGAQRGRVPAGELPCRHAHRRADVRP